jgi:hypothetical protein
MIALTVPSLTSEQRYPSGLLAPRDARIHVRARLAQWGLGVLVQDADVVTSELMTNAVVHGDGAEVGLGLVRTARGVVVLAIDGSADVPVIGGGGALAEGGRGLALIDALCGHRWGYYFDGERKVVWGELLALLQPMRHSVVSRPALRRTRALFL